MASTEQQHWWFIGRRRVIDALLDQIPLPQAGAILEAGCGTGGNLAILARHGRLAAFEPSLDALDLVRARYPEIDVRLGELPRSLPYERESFDMVAALDVLEHVEDDTAAAAALVDLVRPGGWLVVTVPAHQALWGSHDLRLQHYRRYGRSQLLTLFDDPKLKLVRFSPFNIALSPIAVAYRVLERMLGVDLGNQERIPVTLINRVLTSIFSAEAKAIRRNCPIPFGLSYAAVFRRISLT